MQTPPPPPQGLRTGLPLLRLPEQIDEAVDSTDSEEMEEEQDEEQEVPPQQEPSASSKPQDEVKIQDGPEEMVQGSASPLGLRRSPEEGPASTEAGEFCSESYYFGVIGPGYLNQVPTLASL